MTSLSRQTHGPMAHSVFMHDLTALERRFVVGMTELGFGSYECVQIVNGNVLLDPWPTTVRGVKFGADTTVIAETLPDDFQLKRQVVEFIEYVRAVDRGEIRCLTVRHGLPFSMEVILDGSGDGGGDHV
jgi:hypothetical protein